MTTNATMQGSYSIEGVDIFSGQDYNSHGQFVGIDFTAAKATRKSLRFVYVKFGEGSWNGYPLATATAQLSEAKAAGFDVGAYLFDHIEIKPAEQAAYFKKRLVGVSYNLPLMVDVEDECQAQYRHPGAPLTAMEIEQRGPVALNMATHIRDTMDAVSQIDGRAALLYTGDWYISWLLWLAQMKGMDMAWLKKYPLFLASYTAPLMYIPYLVTLDQVVIWQHTSSPTVNQQVNGFPWKERVDMDYWIKSAAEYEVFAGRTGKPAPVELSEAEKVAILWKGHPELWPAG